MSSDWDSLTAVVLWRPQQPNPLGEISGEVEAPHDAPSPTLVSCPFPHYRDEETNTVSRQAVPPSHADRDTTR